MQARDRVPYNGASGEVWKEIIFIYIFVTETDFIIFLDMSVI